MNEPSATAAMTDDTPLPFDLSAVRRKKLTVDFGDGNQSTNGGLLLLRRAERNIGICRRLALRCRIAAMRAGSGTRCSRG